jgi:hypothetical protein
MTLRKLLLGAVATLMLATGSASAQDSPDVCMTNAYDGFVNVKTLPSDTGNVIGQLPNGVNVTLRERFVDVEGVVWIWIEAGALKGWSRDTSLSYCKS